MVYLRFGVLSELYQGQHATVKCDCVSREFDICKGTKQGDPISPMIFSSVLGQVVRKVKEKGGQKKWGIQVSFGSASL